MAHMKEMYFGLDYVTIHSSCICSSFVSKYCLVDILGYSHVFRILQHPKNEK